MRIIKMFYSYEFTNDSDPTRMNNWYSAVPYNIKKNSENLTKIL